MLGYYPQTVDVKFDADDFDINTTSESVRKRNDKILELMNEKGITDVDSIDTIVENFNGDIIDIRIKKDPSDNVNHPKHYKAKNGMEVIDVIEAFTANLNGYEASHTANVIKYICRWKEKNGLEDLKKAQWYLERLIKNIEEGK